MAKKKAKNAAAVALAKLRAKKLSPERRTDIASIAGQTRAVKLTPERRRAIAQKAAADRWKAEKAKKGK